MLGMFHQILLAINLHCFTSAKKAMIYPVFVKLVNLFNICHSVGEYYDIIR